MPWPFVKCYFAIPHGIIASPEEEQGKKKEHKNGYDIALLTAQTDGQMEPRVNSTKDNHTAPEDFGDLKIGTHQPYQPADPLAHGDIEEAQPTCSHFSNCKHSRVLRVSHLEMKMGSETGSGPALQNRRVNLL